MTQNLNVTAISMWWFGSFCMEVIKYVILWGWCKDICCPISEATESALHITAAACATHVWVWCFLWNSRTRWARDGGSGYVLNTIFREHVASITLFSHEGWFYDFGICYLYLVGLMNKVRIFIYLGRVILPALMLILNLPLCCHISLAYIWGLALGESTKEFTPHTCTHHVVIIVIIIAMLTFCYSIMSYTTLILYYHAYMLTLRASLTCTLVATYVMLGRLECYPTQISKC